MAIAATGNTTGVDATTNSTTGVGVFGGANAVTGVNYGVIGGTLSPSGYGGYFRNQGGGSGVALGTGPGFVEFFTLAGSGTRMVVANASGRLSTQTIPGSQWITNGNKIYNANSGFVGIGFSNPSTHLHVNDVIEGSLEANILITNQFTGTSTLDGLRLRMNNLTGSVQNMENGDLFLSTNQGAEGVFGSAYIFLKPTGAVGIGTNNPTAKLEVAGQVKITGGSPGAGKVLTSDATGLASWSTAANTFHTVFSVTGTGANTSGHILNLNYANQSATDILLVTHNYNPGGVGGAYHNYVVGVYWNGFNWTIYNEDTATPMLGKSFNVMVVKQ